MKPVVDRLGQQYSQRMEWLVYFDLNSDAQAGAFASEHGVSAVPTMVLVAADGTEVMRWVGAQPEEILVTSFEAELDRAAP